MNTQTLNAFTELLLQNKSFLVLFILFSLLLFSLFFILGKTMENLEWKAKMQGIIKKERQDAVSRSKAVLGGLAGEQLSPFFPDFPCNPADVRFVGKPLDFVGFPGAAQGEKIEEVLFIEVKTGEAALSRREKDIRDCIENGKVRFVEYRVPE